MDFVLRVRRIAHEVDGQVEELAVGAAGQHVLDGADQAFRLQVARTQAIAAGVQARHVSDGITGVAGIGLGARRLVVLHRAVFQALAHRGAHFAHQRQVFRQRLVGALQHRHALLAFQNLPSRSPGNGRNMVRLTTPTFSLRLSRR
jgi:hypothetical protein